MLIRITAPVKGSASQETSGSWRYLPGTDTFWYDGLGKPPVQIGRLNSLCFVTQLLGPPPEPPKNSPTGGSATIPCAASTFTLFPQPACQAIELSEFNARVTPPTAVDQGESAGALTVGRRTSSMSAYVPSSPVAKLKEIPAAAPISEIRLSVSSSVAAVNASGEPKLPESTFPSP